MVSTNEIQYSILCLAFGGLPKWKFLYYNVGSIVKMILSSLCRTPIPVNVTEMSQVNEEDGLPEKNIMKQHQAQM